MSSAQFEIYKEQGELFEENGFLCINKETNSGLLIDPSTNAFDTCINEREVDIQAIILTHVHIDHILYADYYVDKFQVPLYLHQFEHKKLKDPMLNLSAQMADPFIVQSQGTQVRGQDGKIILPDFAITWRLSPGHSEGNLLLQLSEDIMFVGDSVFKDSIGRYDLPGSNARDHYESLKYLTTLQDALKLYPGHGPKMRVADLSRNAVLQQFLKYGM